MSELIESRIGIIPSDWSIQPLAQSTIKIQDGTHFSPKTTDGPCRYLTSKNVRWGRLDLSDCGRISQKEHDAIYARCDVRHGDVLLTKDGANTGNACLNTLHEPFSLLSSVAILRTDESSHSASFILQYLLSPYGQRRLKDLMSGNAITRLTLQKIKAFETPAPPPHEQRKIARILTTVDNLIEKTEALIAKYQAIKQGMMHDLFTRGVDEHGHLRPPYEEAPELYKQSELGWIPKEWEVVPLSSVAEVGRGKFTPRPRNDPKYYGGAYPFIQTGDVANSIGRYLCRYSQTLNELGTTVSKGFPAGTIAVTIAANIADTAILGIPMFLPDSIVGVVVHPSTNIRYIELCLRRAKHALDAKAPQSAQKNINLDDLRPLPIPLPHQVEQEQIAKLYESNEALLAAEETNLQKLSLQKTGLMQDLLIGKVRVKVDETEEVAASA